MEQIPYLDQAIALTAQKIRRDTGLSLQKFADFARLSKSGVAQVEKAQRNVSLNLVYLLADAAQIDPADLVKEIELERQRLVSKG